LLNFKKQVGQKKITTKDICTTAYREEQKKRSGREETERRELE